MAEGALLELSGNVLKLLGSLILEEVKLAISVKTEIKRLAETVSLIQFLIPESEKQSSHSHQNEDRLRKLKVVLNDAKKLLDDFSTEVDSEVCNFSCSSIPFTYGVKTARGIKAIRKRINDIAEEAESSQSSVEPDMTWAGENVILSTLKLSYNDLPSYLKQCFAYCRLFLKDYKIDVTTLINLWAAQDFIKLSDSKQRVEDVGREYFRELLWRSFFQDVQGDEYGNISYCKMHDLMHDLAALVAGMESTVLTSSKEFNGENVCHVTFDLQDSSRKLPTFNDKGMKIRTILIASVGGRLGNITCDSLVSNFNCLRTLDLSNLNLHVVRSIEKLKYLRYLDLSKNENIKFLPYSITRLSRLLTLKLGGCCSLMELPRGLEKLVNLRHLDISDCSKLTHMPLGLGHLTSLEILTEFVVRQEDLKASSSNWCKKKQGRSGGGLSELKELSNLGGSLFIHGLGHGEDDTVECKATNMKNKQHLQELRLSWVWDYKRDDGETKSYDEMSLEGLQPHPNLRGLELWFYMGVRIPSWVSSLTNLVRFQLFCNERLRHLPPLNQLPFLKVLSLEGLETLEYISDEDSVSNVLGASSSSSSSKTPFFPSLSSLDIRDCPKLKGWWRNSDDDDDNEPHHLLLPSFPPSLSKLTIIDCPNLTSMPLIPDLTSLKVRRIGGCPLLRLHEANREDCPK